MKKLLIFSFLMSASLLKAEQIPLVDCHLVNNLIYGTASIGIKQSVSCMCNNNITANIFEFTAPPPNGLSIPASTILHSTCAKIDNYTSLDLPIDSQLRKVKDLKQIYLTLLYRKLHIQMRKFEHTDTVPEIISLLDKENILFIATSFVKETQNVWEIEKVTSCREFEKNKTDSIARTCIADLCKLRTFTFQE